MLDRHTIAEEREKAAEVNIDGKNPWPGMSYVQGVEDALAWALGELEEAPLNDLDEE